MRASNTSVYDDFNIRHGLTETHDCVIKYVPPGTRVLDVGSAGGYLAESLRDVRGCHVVCLDASARSVQLAQQRGLEAQQVDLDSEPISAQGFDVAIFADVLEHLRRPVNALQQVRDAQLVVVSLPNIAHYSARMQLLAGRFPQSDEGLFDRTHLHFFTRKTMHRLAQDAGWIVTGESFIGQPLPGEGYVESFRRIRQTATSRMPGVFAFQIVLRLERSQ